MTAYSNPPHQHPSGAAPWPDSGFGRQLPEHVSATVAAAAAPRKILEYAAGVMSGRVAVLAEQALSKIRQEIVQYRNPLLAPVNSAEAAHIALEVAVGSLASRQRFTESGQYAWQLGRTRAAEGMPMLSVLRAYRIGASALWEGLVQAVLRDAPAHSHQMFYAADDFWRYAERDTALMVEAHRQASAGIPADDGQRLLPVLRSLLRGHADLVDVSAASAALDLPLDGRYAVVRLEGPAAQGRADAPVRSESDGIRLYWSPYGDGQAVVASLEDHPLAELAAAVDPGPGARGGISPVVTGLSELRRARELAELALGTCRGDGDLALLGNRMPAGFVLSRPDLAAELTADVFRRLAELDPTDRSLLLDTLEVWLDCQGSTDRASELLYCHRNTVLNRLRRLERLTGRRLDHPRDLVDLTLALEASRFAARRGGHSGRLAPCFSKTHPQ